MAKQTFTWFPDQGATFKDKPSVNVSKFGDGYEARTPVGINNRLQTWSLSFTGRPSSESNAILAFLEARNGSEAFYWTTPRGLVGSFVCREWDGERAGGTAIWIKCSFEQVAEA